MNFREYIKEEKDHNYSKNTLEELELLLKHHIEDAEEAEGKCKEDVLYDIEKIKAEIAKRK